MPAAAAATSPAGGRARLGRAAVARSIVGAADGAAHPGRTAVGGPRSARATRARQRDGVGMARKGGPGQADPRMVVGSVDCCRPQPGAGRGGCGAARARACGPVRAVGVRCLAGIAARAAAPDVRGAGPRVHPGTRRGGALRFPGTPVGAGGRRDRCRRQGRQAGEWTCDRRSAVVRACGALRRGAASIDAGDRPQRIGDDFEAHRDSQPLVRRSGDGRSVRRSSRTDRTVGLRQAGARCLRRSCGPTGGREPGACSVASFCRVERCRCYGWRFGCDADCRRGGGDRRGAAAGGGGAARAGHGDSREARDILACAGSTAQARHEDAAQGLYLAGDWTDTGLPGTIESAVVSGHAAARAWLEDSVGVVTKPT